MSPDSEVIWIFVAFLVMIEIVSDMEDDYILRFIVIRDNLLLIAKPKAPCTLHG